MFTYKMKINDGVTYKVVKPIVERNHRELEYKTY